MSKYALFFLVLAALASACNYRIVCKQSFYVSPFNGNAQDYHALPLRTDSTHSSVYARASFAAGSANDDATDQFAGGKVSVYLARHRGLFQWYYGVDASLGSFNLGKWDTGHRGGIELPPLSASKLNALSGPRTYGGAGFSGGVNGVIRMGQGEWRFLGVETALHQEFGDYLRFRRQLPDSLAGYVVRQPFFGTMGLHTEIVLRIPKGDFGFRFAYGWALGAAKRKTNRPFSSPASAAAFF